MKSLAANTLPSPVILSSRLLDIERNLLVESNESETLKCPQCRAKLTLLEAITILNGTGFQRIAKIKLPDGKIAFLEAGKVNPNAVEILE